MHKAADAARKGLGLPAHGLATAVVATVGYRSAADKYAGAPKVRFPKKEIFLQV